MKYTGRIQLTSRLEGSTTDEETVNVLLLAELATVLLVDTAAVQDAGLVGNLVADVGLEPVTDGLVNLLSLLGGGNLAGTNGPDGLVGDDNLGPVRDLGLEGGELFGDDGDGVAGLTLLEALTAAPDDAEAVGGGILGLGGNNLVRLAEDGTALRVSEDGPVDLGVGELGNGKLTSEGTIGLVVDVLGGDFDLGANLLTDRDEVESAGSNDDLYEKDASQ